jgi:hypothetical protein
LSKIFVAVYIENGARWSVLVAFGIEGRKSAFRQPTRELQLQAMRLVLIAAADTAVRLYLHATLLRR